MEEEEARIEEEKARIETEEARIEEEKARIEEEEARMEEFYRFRGVDQERMEKFYHSRENVHARLKEDNFDGYYHPEYEEQVNFPMEFEFMAVFEESETDELGVDKYFCEETDN
jgi:uncharacterized membrane protein